MRTRYSRTIATATALATGGLAVLALRPPQTVRVSAVAERNPAVEVRTEIIRRTIRIIRHEPGAAHLAPPRVHGVWIESHRRARTGASGAHHSVSAAVPALSTRASGSRARAPLSTAAPVATRTSGSHGATSAPAAAGSHVTTRTSGSGSHSGGTTGRPVSRTSGGGGEHSDDGRSGGGGDD